MTDDLQPVSPFFMRDPFRDFLKREGVPVYEDMLSADCLTLPLEPWKRMGGLGAYVHIPGRGDFVTCYIAEIPPGGKLNPERHVYEEIMFVLSGRGATTIELPDGKTSFEWGPGSLFGIPLNLPHQIFNGSGSEPARLIGLTSMPIALNLYHNEDFVFDNPFWFKDRIGDLKYFKGEGEFRTVFTGRHQWETNFIPDLATLDVLQEWSARGAGGKSVMFAIADSTLHAHVSEFPAGTYKKSHRRPSESGVYIFCVSGHGYSLLWQEDESPVDTLRVDWKPGTMFCNGAGEHYHQHFNTAKTPSRYLAMGFGNVRWPVLDYKRATYAGADKSVKDGGRQIEYEDEDPRVLAMFDQELTRRGIESQMSKFVGVR
jgi:mannose-6-phosphate isomerase-like protein (cupin superfamily)